MSGRLINKLCPRTVSSAYSRCLSIRSYTRRRLNLWIILIPLLLAFIHFCNLDSLSAVRASRFKPQSSSSGQIMYVIRTSSRFFKTCLIYSLQTWVLLVQKHVYYVTDQRIPTISPQNQILSYQTCKQESHSMRDLCCKTAHDFLLFYRHRKTYDWFCHFDDDQYVHVKNLEKYLSTLDSNQAYYIGRNSWLKPVQRRKKPFWFGTLGAGVCLSKTLLDQLESHTQPVSEYVNGCLRQNYFNDIYLGYLVSEYANITLTKAPRFHSHLEKDLYNDSRRFFETFTKQITFGFRRPDRYPRFLPDFYQSSNDPYRIRALHCLLYPSVHDCQFRIHQHLFNLTT